MNCAMSLTILVVILCMTACCHAAQAEAVLQTDELRVTIDNTGQVSGLFDRARGVEYAAAGQEAALLRVRAGDRFEVPTKMAWDAAAQRIQLTYESLGVEAAIQTVVKPTHMILELVSLAPLDKVSAVQWGPLPTTIGKTVGEIVGVVRGDVFAIGIQVMNVKTLGGFFPGEEGRDTSRSQTAKATEWGSTLQAYSMDRSRPRNVSVWGDNFPNMPVPPIEGETVVGSKIALFGCPEPEALERVGAIEVAEGLPHPVFDGVWVKQSDEAGRPYLIASFSEKTFGEVLTHAVRANLATVYHGGPFKSWGHYELDPRQFPDGAESMKRCVEKARPHNVRVGVHTLTNFINTNDAYVSPVPDPRLAKTGVSQLTADIDDTTDMIQVASPEYFDNTKANWLHTVMIGEELVRYRAASEQAPYTLLDCQRGAFGTKAAAHKAGDAVAKLLDHPYKVFFPNYDMQHEIAQRMAELFNETGLTHMDFDGHEGCWASGQGDFAVEMFAKVFYDHLDHAVYNGTSGSQPFYWHINTTINWGEPWYGGFRDSQADYRFNNQPLLERNYVPCMLGWFAMTRDTTLADIEWMLARCAGYEAGFALATDLIALRRNAATDSIMDAIREWDTARRGGAFSAAQREMLRDPGREFHLEKTGDGAWELYPYHASEEFIYEHYVRQPGEPTGVEWAYTNPDEKQPVQFQVAVRGESGALNDLVIEFDSYARIEIPEEIQAGQKLACDGTSTLRLYDAKGRQTKAFEYAGEIPTIGSGAHTIAVSGAFTGDPPPEVAVQFKTKGKPESIRLGN